MPVTRLDPTVEASLRSARVTYAEVGQSAGGLPHGYAAFSRTSTLKTRDYRAACDALLGWQVQLRSGIRVAASSEHVEAGSVVVMKIGTTKIGVTAPCRVVYIIDEPKRQGFAYGTLPGHPESGEEAFILEAAEDGQLTFTVTAFSRPATFLTKVSGPLGKTVQRAMTSRYLRALDKP